MMGEVSIHKRYHLLSPKPQTLNPKPEMIDMNHVSYTVHYTPQRADVARDE